VRVVLTSLGSDMLEKLSSANMQELAELGPTMRTLWKAIEQFEQVRTS
jgi:hypothetical protein